MSHRVWMACVLSCWAMAAHAAKPDLFGVDVDLPFEYTLRKVEDRRSGGSTVTVDQRHHLELASADGGEPQELLLTVTYLAPQGVSNSAMQQAFDDEFAKSSSRPGMRDTPRSKSTASVPVHRCPWKKVYPERMSIGGIVNGALVRVSAFAKDASPLVPELAERLKCRNRYAETCGRRRTSGRIEDRRDRRRARRPLSRVGIGRGVRPGWPAATTQTDANGRPMSVRGRSACSTGFEHCRDCR